MVFSPAEPTPVRTAIQRRHNRQERLAPAADRNSCPACATPAATPRSAHLTAKPRLPVVDGSGLVPAATIVVQAAQRQRRLERVPQEQTPKPVRDPAGKSPYRTRDGNVNDLSGESFAG